MSDHEANNQVYEIIVSTFRLSYNQIISIYPVLKIKILNIIDSYKYIYPEGYSVIRPLPCPYIARCRSINFFPNA